MMEAYVHVIAGLAVLSRAADVLTTYFVTPTLRLEANIIARRFGWKFAVLTIPVGLVAYPSPPLGVVVLTVSFMVAESNASKILIAKALGEKELAALTRRVFLVSPPWPGLLYLVMPAFFIGILGVAILFFYPLESQWGYYFGMGMLIYAGAILFWHPLRYFHIRAEAKKKAGVIESNAG